MKSKNPKPTANERLIGFLALAALAWAHVRPIRLALDDLAGEPHVETVLDSILGVWGAFVLMMSTVVMFIGGGLIVFHLIAIGLQWIAWAVTDGGIARPGGCGKRAEGNGEDEGWPGPEDRK